MTLMVNSPAVNEDEILTQDTSIIYDEIIKIFFESVVNNHGSNNLLGQCGKFMRNIDVMNMVLILKMHFLKMLKSLPNIHINQKCLVHYQ